MNINLFMTALKAHLEKDLATLPLKMYSRTGTGMPSPLAVRNIVPPINSTDTQNTREDKVNDFLETKPAQVFIGSMPDTVNEALGVAPFVVIQVFGGYLEGGLQHFTSVLRVCVASEEREECESDLHNLISLLMRSLITLPHGVLDGLYRLEGKSPTEAISWERPDEQVRPFLQGHVFTGWNMKGISAEYIPE